MRTIVLYDSLYGNTEIIARAVASAFDPLQTEILHINNVTTENLGELNLLIVGSPTQGFNPTKLLKEYLNFIPGGNLKDVSFASFDTRIGVEYLNTKFMKFMVKTFGYAGSSISRVLTKKGGKKIVEPEGFFVTDIKGPLKEGEEERAREWGKKILAAVNHSN